MGNFFKSMFDTDYITDPADLFGRRQAETDYNRSQKNIDKATKMAKAVSASAGEQSKQALEGMTYYDLITKGNVGLSAEDYMKKQQEAASKMSELTGQTAATQGSRAALKSARTSGLSKGQSALAASQSAGDIFSNAYNQALQANKGQYNTAVGTQAGLAQDMSNRNVNALNTQLGAAGIPMGIGQGQAQAAATKQAGSQAALGSAAGAIAGIMSDENAKENIQEIGNDSTSEESLIPNNKFDYSNAKDSLDVMKIAEAIRPVLFNYKDKIVEDGKATEGDHIGVIAQDLEDTPLQSAVITGEDGLKRINTEELTPALLNLIVQLAKKVEVLEGKLQ